MFQGGALLTMDGKGRITIPAQHRDALLAANSTAKLTLTRHKSGCLLLFPQAVWDIKRREIETWSSASDADKRMYLGMAQSIDLDQTGRVLVPPPLRQFAGLEKDATLMGLGLYAEIWDNARLAEYEAATRHTPQTAEVANFKLGVV